KARAGDLVKQQRCLALALRGLRHGGELVLAADFPRNLAHLAGAPQLFEIVAHCRYSCTLLACLRMLSGMVRPAALAEVAFTWRSTPLASTASSCPGSLPSRTGAATLRAQSTPF